MALRTRHEGCPRAELSSAVTRLQVDEGLGKGRNWSPPPAGHQSYPVRPWLPWPGPKNVNTAPTPAPFPAAPAGSGARLQAPELGECPGAGGGGVGARRGGASAPRGALFPAARRERSVDRGSCAHHAAGYPDQGAGAWAGRNTAGPTE